jgi:hypothetical protein
MDLKHNILNLKIQFLNMTWQIQNLLEFLTIMVLEVGVYAAWYGPGDTKLEAGSCKYDHAH